MANQGKRMVPEYLIKEIGEGGGGTEYTAGTGIDITNNEISVDTETVAMKSELPDAVSGTNDGTNWTSITIGDTTKAIPQGGSGFTIIDIDTDYQGASSGTLTADDLAKLGPNTLIKYTQTIDNASVESYFRYDYYTAYYNQIIYSPERGQVTEGYWPGQFYLMGFTIDTTTGAYAFQGHGQIGQGIIPNSQETPVGTLSTLQLGSNTYSVGGVNDDFLFFGKIIADINVDTIGTEKTYLGSLPYSYPWETTITRNVSLLKLNNDTMYQKVDITGLSNNGTTTIDVPGEGTVNVNQYSKSLYSLYGTSAALYIYVTTTSGGSSDEFAIGKTYFFIKFNGTPTSSETTKRLIIRYSTPAFDMTLIPNYQKYKDVLINNNGSSQRISSDTETELRLYAGNGIVLAQSQSFKPWATISTKIPECPTTTDGTYVLKATVSNGTVTYSWVLEV